MPLYRSGSRMGARYEAVDVDVGECEAVFVCVAACENVDAEVSEFVRDWYR